MTAKEILAKLGFKVDDKGNVEIDQAAGDGKAAGDNNTAQLVSLVATLVDKLNNPQTSSRVDYSDSDVVKLADILARAMPQVKTPTEPYSEGFYNNETGAFDLSKISDATLKGALEDYTAKQAAKETQRIIEAAYETELAKHNLAIDKEVFRKAIDLSGVTVKDGKAAGMEEAFNALNDKGVYKAQPANPLNSGFKPMENVTNNTGNLTGGAGLYAAAQMDAEIQK